MFKSFSRLISLIKNITSHFTESQERMSWKGSTRIIWFNNLHSHRPQIIMIKVTTLVLPTAAVYPLTQFWGLQKYFRESEVFRTFYKLSCTSLQVVTGYLVIDPVTFLCYVCLYVFYNRNMQFGCQLILIVQKIFILLISISYTDHFPLHYVIMSTISHIYFIVICPFISQRKDFLPKLFDKKCGGLKKIG